MNIKQILSFAGLIFFTATGISHATALFQSTFPATESSTTANHNRFIPRDTTLCAHMNMTLCAHDTNYTYHWLSADSTLLEHGEDTSCYSFEGLKGSDGFGMDAKAGNPSRYLLQYRHKTSQQLGFDTIDIHHILRPWVQIPSQELICQNLPVTITPKLPEIEETFYEVSWSDGEKESKREFTEGGSYIITFGVKEEHNLCGYEPASDSIEIIWVDTALTHIGIPTDTIICLQNTLELDVRVPYPSTRYSWGKGPIQPDFDPEIDSITFTDSKITIEEEGVYNILLIDSMGCYNHKEINITSDDCLPSIDIPNVFTPNGDGINDILKFRTLEKCTDVDIHIVNRWGRTVLRSQVKTAEDFEWNGCMQNSSRKLPDGPYFYMVSYKDYYGKRKTQSGSITILGSAGR